jgi:hypothetical protein
MFKLFLSLSLAAGCVSAATAFSVSTGQATPEGFVDPNWTILAAPAGSGMNTSGAAYVETNPAFWVTAPLGSNWISAGDCDASLTAACAAGTYRFINQFNLTDTTWASLTFKAAADNEVQVYLNGNLLLDRGDVSDIFNHTGFNTLGTPTVVGPSSGFFHVGANTLELRVLNAGSSYTGGLLDGTVETAPEPGSVLLGGLGLLSLVGLRKLRRQ